MIKINNINPGHVSMRFKTKKSVTTKVMQVSKPYNYIRVL